jgi:ADP-ribosylglycohydrolase
MEKIMNNRRSLEHVAGCLLGGAVGDALGASVEFMSLYQILKKYGSEGIGDYDRAYGRKGAVTDDTQMTLFTAEGLILSHMRGKPSDLEQVSVFVYQAYLRWLTTQIRDVSPRLVAAHGSCAIADGQLVMKEALYSQRAPGRTCLSSLMSGKMGRISDPVNNSKGCGGVMRIAPVAYFLKPDAVFDAACEIAAITHGHPTGYLAAGCLARMISGISYGQDILTAAEESIQKLKTTPSHHECLNALTQAIKAAKEAPVCFETVEKLGKGWIAEEALAIGLYCALAAGDNFEKGMRLAVNHGGDSDSTGSITGNILGALHGKKIIPQKYLTDLELLDLIEEISADLFERMPDNQVQ